MFYLRELFSCDVLFITDMLIVILAGFAGFFLAIHCLIALFSPLNAINWTLLAFAVIISSIIFVILFVISVLIRKLSKRRSVLSQYKCFSVIGYGGIALCGIASRISVYFFVGNNIYINYYIAFIYFVTSFLICCIILRPNSKHFEIEYFLDGTKSWFWTQVVLHIIVLIVQIRIAIAFFEDGHDRGAIIGCQLGYSIFCVPSIFDFCQVLREGGVKLRDNNNNISNNNNNTTTNVDDQKQTLVTANVEIGNSKEIRDPEADNKLKLECKICMLEYSETRIPRMLKECGHTVCEVCANELLKKNDQRYLCCPFCQEATVVKGPANLLPKNYIALEVIEKMK